jgi:hypothetical protein
MQPTIMSMMRMPCMQFIENVAIYNMSHLSPWRKEMGAMAVNPRMVPLHNPVSATRRDVGAKEIVRKCGTCKSDGE